MKISEFLFREAYPSTEQAQLTIHEAKQVLANVRYTLFRGEGMAFEITPEGDVWISIEKPRCTCCNQQMPVLFKYEPPSYARIHEWTESGVVDAAYRAVVFMESHDRGEGFLYKGKPIYNPHFRLGHPAEHAIDPERTSSTGVPPSVRASLCAPATCLKNCLSESPV